MRLLILSDLHLEAWGEHAPRIDIEGSRPDAIILAGDIHTGTRAIAWADRMFPELPVLYVHGNHEGYGERLDSVRIGLEDMSARTGHIHYLDSTELVMGSMRFLGTTLWTDFRLSGDAERPAALQAAQNQMNDYRQIRLASQGDRKLRASDTARWHQEQKIWLAAKLAAPFLGITVVITHMAPSTKSIPGRYAGELLSAAFASHLDDLVAQADLWIHGHTHDSADYSIGKCRVVSNPCGYPRAHYAPENPNFDPGLIIELA
jgi:predicted phosphodiesterase